MNTYLVPVSDKDDCWIETYHGKDLFDVKERIMRELIDSYDVTDSSYSEFSKELFDKYNIIIGIPEDINTFD